MAIGREDAPISRDPKSGLFFVSTADGNVISLTLAQYEAGLRVLALREKAAVGMPR